MPEKPQRGLPHRPLAQALVCKANISVKAFGCDAGQVVESILQPDCIKRTREASTMSLFHDETLDSTTCFFGCQNADGMWIGSKLGVSGRETEGLEFHKNLCSPHPTYSFLGSYSKDPIQG